MGSQQIVVKVLSILLGVLGLCVAVLAAARTPQSYDFLRIVAQYRETLAEAAIKEFATWPDARVRAEQAHRDPTSDPWTSSAAALLHLEAGLRNAGFEAGDQHMLAWNRFGSALSSEGLARILQLADRARSAGDAELTEFVKDLLVVRNLIFFDTWGSNSRSFPESARRWLADDPEVQLALGANAAAGMGPRRTGDGPYGVDWGTPERPPRLISSSGEEYNADEAREAEVALRRAVGLNPGLVEARLRLGRVYQLTNKRGDALRELIAAAETARLKDDPLTLYLAELFLGQLQEDVGRSVDALAAYGRAISAFPAGYAARLGLGRRLIASGRPEEGWAAVRSVFGADLGPPARDPWSRFPAPRYWRITDRLSVMRAKVSRTPFTDGSIPVSSEGKKTKPPIRLSPPLLEPVSGLEQRTPVFRTRTTSVRVEALVLEGGQPVIDLKPDDFRVTDNGVPQRIDAVTTAKSLALAIVVDTSHSMEPAESRQWARRAVNDISEALVPGDRYSVVAVSDRLSLRGDDLEAPDLLRMLMTTIQPELRTRSSLWDGVLAAGGLIAESPGRPVVLIVSDGWDNASWFERRRAFRQFERWGLVVDAIAVPFKTSPVGDDIVAGDVSLRPLEALTGGSLLDGTSPDLGRMLSDRFKVLRQSYVLTYTPEKVRPRPDGWHEIKVTLRPGVSGRVQARPGYYSRQDRN